MPRLPEYLKRNIIDTEKTKNVRKILKDNCLNTVCDGARCPNKNECYQKNTATFLIMGNVCTRNCRYCNITCEKPQPLDKNEPQNISKAVKELGLKYVVITSVTRDDLLDGGACHFAKCIEEIREMQKRGDGEDGREYPSPEFLRLASSPRTSPSPARGEGAAPDNFPIGPEAETQFVIAIIEEFKPDIILTLHAPYKVVNYDGPAEKLAQDISEIIGYPTSNDIGYPTPGSMGTYAGVERNIPIITLEVDEEIDVNELVAPVNKIFDYLAQV